VRRRTGAGTALLALAAWWPAPALAQQTAEAFLGDRTHDNELRATFGIDPALALGAGYMRAVDLGAGSAPRRVGLHADVTAILGLSSWDVGAGASMLVRQERGVDLLATLDLGLKVAQNDVHTAIVYGYGAALRPGWFDSAWYAALDLSLRGTIAATVLHGAEYRRLFPGVADGTYPTDHLAFFAGVAGGFQIKQRALIGARFAWRFPRTFESYSPYFLPYTINIDVGLRF
jgi:hypothetical protein